MYGFVTVPEFSVLMGISTDTVYRLVKNKTTERMKQKGDVV